MGPKAPPLLGGRRVLWKKEGGEVDWISALKDLPVGIAFAVVLVVAVYFIVRTIVRHIVDPMRDAIHRGIDSLEIMITNHLEHDQEERREMRKAIEKNTRIIEVQCRLIRDLIGRNKD